MTVEYTLLALAVPALLAAAGFAVWTRLRTRRMLDTLGKMLDDAIRGEFRESLYDESRLSALETRMAHWLWSIRRRSCGSSSTRWSRPPGWRAASLP